MNIVIRESTGVCQLEQKYTNNTRVGGGEFTKKKKKKKKKKINRHTVKTYSLFRVAYPDFLNLPRL